MKANILKKVGVAILTVGILAGCAPAGNTDTGSGSNNTEKIRLSIGAELSAGAQFPFWTQYASMIQKYSDKYEVTVAETGGSVENMNRLGAKDFQIIQSDTPCVYKAYHAEDTWEGQDFSNLRTMFPFVHAPMMFAVSEDTDIYEIEDLDGKDFGAGAGSQTEDAARSALAALGVEPVFPEMGVNDVNQMMKDGRIDGVVRGMTSTTTVSGHLLDIMTVVDLRFLSFTKEQLETIEKKYPYLTPSTIPADVFEGQSEPVDTYGYYCVAATTSDMDEDIVYELTKIAFEHKDEIDESYPAAAFDWEEILPKMTAPLHAGAVKYYLEQGIDIPEELIPPEYKG